MDWLHLELILLGSASLGVAFFWVVMFLFSRFPPGGQRRR